MLAKTHSFTLNGLEGKLIEIEADLNNGLPSYELVGLADTAVKESKERIRSALKNSGKNFPLKKITVNLAPADLKKEGAYLDLAIGIALLKASEQLLFEGNTDTVFLGELSLDGSLRPINGVLPVLISAKAQGFTSFVLPKGNEKEASYIEGIDVYAAESLTEVCLHLTGKSPLAKTPFVSYKTDESAGKNSFDMKYVKGQSAAKRAVEIAVSGGHNILFIGPPGAGKTMLARCIPGIMPDMAFDEALEVTKIHSVAGILSADDGIVKTRPFRTPHHTATTVSLCGGGNRHLRPGEISLAHNGVLFLDELPEYSRSTLESLRQPLEDGVITITRASACAVYPANFILCASMNPCPCGNYGSSEKECVCRSSEVRKYRGRISGPLLDRIDLQVEVDNIKYDDLTSDSGGESSSEVKKRVDAARNIQKERFFGSELTKNSDMGERELKEHCALSPSCERVLKSAFESLKLSARARSRIIKVARTIADLQGGGDIEEEHILEAVSYRSLDT